MASRTIIAGDREQKRNHALHKGDIEARPHSSIYIKNTHSTMSDDGEDQFETNPQVKTIQGEEEDDDDNDDIELLDREVVLRLARRARHLPGNNWCQDWTQFMLNNHPVFGICFRDRRHPLGPCDRFVLLIGSLAFGISATNTVYMYYEYGSIENDQTLFTINFHIEQIEQLQERSFPVTCSALSMWVAGSLLHTMFDL